ncbi:fungal hydrophobin-domain-containing protein [Crassisporium funariophilum]|nr:fungal hydrophobin-domain-containing protein [Crassisporium funariophilum]
MFSKIALFAAASMAVFVAAAPTPGGIQNSCNTGPVQCCNSTMDGESEQFNAITALLGIVTGPVTGQVGVNCTPLTVVGLGSGASCTQQPVCCEGNNFNGLIVIGCSPTNINA